MVIEMTELTPTILVDSREQQPLVITAFPVEVAGLVAGDYGVKFFSDFENPAFVLERKSLSDLIGSLTQSRERFMREIERLRRFRFSGILIEASQAEVARGEYLSKATPASILASLAAIQVRAGVHLFWTGDHEGAARQLERLVRQFARGIMKDHARLLKACEEQEAVVAQ